MGSLLLGVINIAVVVAVLIAIGLVIEWIMGWLGFPVPENLRKVYVIIVALIALYMIVALLLGLPSFGPLGVGPRTSFLR